MYKRNFNSGWTAADAAECRDIFDEPPVYKPVTLPHDAMILKPRSENSVNENTTGFYDGVSYIYKKTLNRKDYPDADRFILRFDGVYMHARVYVNEEIAGACAYGYSRFYVDITQYLLPDADNEIKVTAQNDMQLTSRWYTGCGIYRNVYLYTGREAYFLPGEIKVDSKPLKKGAHIRAEAKIFTSAAERSSCSVRFSVIDADGVTVKEAFYPLSLQGPEEYEIVQNIYLDSARLWSLDDPYLYTLRCELIKDAEILDKTESTFGIREITADPSNGLMINGKPVKLRGGCIHHDNGPLGAATFKEAEYRRIKKMKEAGFNAVRSAHDPASEELLCACDELGLLVLDEAYDMWTVHKSDHDFADDFEANWKYDLKAMVDKDYDHPCVFVYSVGNEITEIASFKGKEINRKLCSYIKELDKNRFVSGSVNGMFAVMSNIAEVFKDLFGSEEELPREINTLMTKLDANMGAVAAHPVVGKATEEIFAAYDICGYNYMDSRYAQDRKDYPERIIMGTESFPPAVSEIWQRVDENSHVIGDFVWTAWDYIGESGIGKVDYSKEKAKGIYGPWPWYLAYCGDFDITGQRRPQSYYRQIVWGLRKEPYIAVQNPDNYGKTAAVTNWSWPDVSESWTWPGCEGKTTLVQVYTDAPEAELFLNGRSLGIKPAGNGRFKHLTEFEIPYEPGILKAVAVRGGISQESFTLKSASEKSFLKICAPEKSPVKGEVAFIDITFEDEDGTVDTSAKAEVTLSVEGGQLLGFASADPVSTENFFDKTRTPYQGRLLACVRAENSEEIKITARAKGFETARLILPVQ